jgi:hypothetical protein
MTLNGVLCERVKSRDSAIFPEGSQSRSLSLDSEHEVHVDCLRFLVVFHVVDGENSDEVVVGLQLAAELCRNLVLDVQMLRGVDFVDRKLLKAELCSVETEALLFVLFLTPGQLGEIVDFGQGLGLQLYLAEGLLRDPVAVLVIVGELHAALTPLDQAVDLAFREEEDLRARVIAGQVAMAMAHLLRRAEVKEVDAPHGPVGAGHSPTCHYA